MKTIHSDFRQFCFDNFDNNEEIANKVCNFYRKHIKVRGAKSSLDAKKKNIKAILSNYSEKSLIDVIDYFLDMERRGTLSELTLPYFEKCVENKFSELTTKKQKPSNSGSYITKKSKSVLIETPIKRSEVLTPIVDEQLNYPINNNISLKDNFSFLCPNCQNPLFTDLDQCTNCLSKVDYSQVDFKNFIQ